jgi:hypothetical protein
VTARILWMMLLIRMRRTVGCGRETINGMAGRARTTQLRKSRSLLADVAFYDRISLGIWRIRRVRWRGRELSRSILDRRVVLMVMVLVLVMATVVVRLLVVSWRQRRLWRTREGGRRLI